MAKTYNQIVTEIQTLLADNTVRDISEEDMRTVCTDLLDYAKDVKDIADAALAKAEEVDAEANLKMQYGLTGTVDGTNVNFTIAENYRPTSLRVYVNGVRQYLGVDYRDYDTAGEPTNKNKIIFIVAPPLNSKIVVDYVPRLD